MEKVVAFLKEAETYYLGTVDGDKPVLRPFGTIHIYEGKVYFQTGKKKAVYQQLKANPNVFLCAMAGDKWIRVAAEAVEDDSIEAQKSLLDAYPSLQKMYTPGDGNSVVFYLKNATASFNSFTEAPEIVQF